MGHLAALLSDGRTIRSGILKFMQNSVAYQDKKVKFP